MNPLRHLAVFFSRAKVKLKRRILVHRILYHNPTLVCDPTTIWDYGYSDLDAIKIGKNVAVGAFTEIVVYKKVRYSSVAGKLTLSDNTVVTTGVSIRAAGGEIFLGEYSGIGTNSVLVASTHSIEPGKTFLYKDWDESKTGIRSGRNVWVGASCMIMPGVEIGDDVIVGAGSVVTKNIPSGEIWAGVPARFLKKVSA